MTSLLKTGFASLGVLILTAMVGFLPSLADATPVQFVNGQIEGELTFGDKIFSNIRCVSQEINCDNLTADTVSSGGNAAIQFAGAMGATAGNVADIQFFYTVRTNDDSDRIIGISGTIVGSGTPGTFASVAESVFDPEDSNALVGFISQTVGLDQADPAYEADDMNLTGAFNILDVQKDVFIDARNAQEFGGASISIITQDFAQIPVPEPSVTILLGMALVGIFGLCRKMM